MGFVSFFVVFIALARVSATSLRRAFRQLRPKQRRCNLHFGVQTRQARRGVKEVVAIPAVSVYKNKNSVPLRRPAGKDREGPTAGAGKRKSLKRAVEND